MGLQQPAAVRGEGAPLGLSPPLRHGLIEQCRLTVVDPRMLEEHHLLGHHRAGAAALVALEGAGPLRRTDHGDRGHGRPAGGRRGHQPGTVGGALAHVALQLGQARPQGPRCLRRVVGHQRFELAGLPLIVGRRGRQLILPVAHLVPRRFRRRQAVFRLRYGPPRPGHIAVLVGTSLPQLIPRLFQLILAAPHLVLAVGQAVGDDRGRPLALLPHPFQHCPGAVSKAAQVAVELEQQTQTVDLSPVSQADRPYPCWR